MRAERIVEALGGHKVGRQWIACCPAHEDRKPSLSIRDAGDGKVLVRCHAGCEQRDVIAALRSYGLWSGPHHRPTRPAPKALGTSQQGRPDAENSEFALRLWDSTRPATGTPVETYLASRGLHLPPPPTLSFHPTLKHPSGGIWPAMVALVTRGVDNVPVAFHRTFLARDGNGKAPVDTQRMMLGRCRGAAVRLAEPGDVLMVGEGIESCLAAMQATGQAAWAALSTSGLRNLDLPRDVRNVIVLADGDDAGENAARAAAARWTREDRQVRIARPQWGMDFNDLLCVDERQKPVGVAA